ncbi:MAG: hypothetical protein FJY37_00250 [Betaproteobacteria bacterium]|nr:hypothetical protein [Betaproteobacteria bacterium]
MIYCFDIDGTLCTSTDGDYLQAEPFHERIAVVNALYVAGHVIKLFTARGSTSGIDWREVTERQMRAWNVRYHSLIMGKPDADIFIDDKAFHADHWTWKVE